eukprot:Blabericola_migrator_1__4851@NODE_2542_length_2627_cov_219_626563_g454_i2_p5_GENE_NODE_2542_length_2627_cov_219_626563_g454_i2NODE_2542_length_2627_cov_219_626563_g454_i2_p5_ORF_typecomplete_len142_score13_36_NODE_2542_length_2627_cov_219_626563_g454_i2258683
MMFKEQLFAACMVRSPVVIFVSVQVSVEVPYILPVHFSEGDTWSATTLPTLSQPTFSSAVAITVVVMVHPLVGEVLSVMSFLTSVTHSSRVAAALEILSSPSAQLTVLLNSSLASAETIRAIVKSERKIATMLMLQRLFFL